MYGDYGGRSSSAAESVRRFFLRGGSPITLGLIIANVLTFFLILSGSGQVIVQYLAFNTQTWPRLFWTFLTWPLIGAADPLGLLFSLGWVYTFGGSLERSWGVRVYGVCVAAAAAIVAVAMWLGSLLPGIGMGGLAGLWVLGGVMAVAWALTNRSEVLSFFGLPLPAPALILAGCAVTWFHAGMGLGGMFALAGCAAAWWYVTKGRYGSYPGFAVSRGTGAATRRNDSPNLRFQDFGRETAGGTGRGGRKSFSLSRWWRERQERKRLEAMFRRSGYTDPEERRRN
ncbi:MAG: hypothetical protein H7Z41_02530 [Cytophagales bacterium]|nr:hypothetical protein [Armatimonadota bacterium]